MSTPRILMSALVLVATLAVTGCGSQEEALQDHTGTTQGEIEDLSIKEQYELAEQRYVALHEFSGEVQAQIHDGEWTASDAGADINPGAGSALGRAPEGATRENSYYFRTYREYTPSADEDLQEIIRQTAQDWQDRGWDVSIEDIELSDDIRVTAHTPDHYWFELAQSVQAGQLAFTGNSPVYWADRPDLADAIYERREAQDRTADDWPVEDQSPETRCPFLPGDHRPFPAWDIVDEDRDHTEN